MMNRSLALVGLAASFGLVGVFIACGGGDSPPVMEIGAADVKGAYTNFAINGLTLPTMKTDFTIDLIGDGRPHNQLGNIIGTLATQNLDAQSGVDQSINNGNVSILLSLQNADPTLKTDSPAGVTFYLGKSSNGMYAKDDAGNLIPDGGCTGCPNFGGMGMFTVDAAGPTPTFFGKATTGHFNSNSPVSTKMPITITLKVALIPGGDPIGLIINGAHIQFDVTGTVGNLTLMNGQINGSIKDKDVQGTIIPAVALLLTQRIAADPKSSTSMTILGLFDMGNCSNADGTMAKKGDGKVDACEVAMNGIIQAVLAPDIQVYDAIDGSYKPNKLNTTKDSLSLGIRFKAVQGNVTGAH